MKSERFVAAASRTQEALSAASKEIRSMMSCLEDTNEGSHAWTFLDGVIEKLDSLRRDGDRFHREFAQKLFNQDLKFEIDGPEDA
jgi:uncharacterized protein Yka (UPF0111/DUF47 family)